MKKQKTASVATPKTAAKHLIFIGKMFLTSLPIFLFVACPSDTKIEEEQVPKVYGIPVTGINAETHAATIAEVFDEMDTWGAGYVNHVNYIKNNIKEFRIVADLISTEVINEGGKAIVRISSARFGLGQAGIDEIANALYDWVVLQGVVLHLDKSIRIADNKNAKEAAYKVALQFKGNKKFVNEILNEKVRA